MSHPAGDLYKGALNTRGLGKVRYVVERTPSLLHHFKCLAVHWEGRLHLPDVLDSLASSPSAGDA
ncbi:hypothetical protein [Streptomyces sp. NPDC057403]|uniref:hypothetical protein n=1 Tax=Streptomyces sp. NPDC057403 TaxID=3346119 RepID=UPI0036CCDBF8